MSKIIILFLIINEVNILKPFYGVINYLPPKLVTLELIHTFSNDDVYITYKINYIYLLFIVITCRYQILPTYCTITLSVIFPNILNDVLLFKKLFSPFAL